MTMTAEWPLVDDDDTTCMDCHRYMPVDSPYSTRLIGMVDGDSVAEVICVYCATPIL